MGLAALDPPYETDPGSLVRHAGIQIAAERRLILPKSFKTAKNGEIMARLRNYSILPVEEEGIKIIQGLVAEERNQSGSKENAGIPNRFAKDCYRR